MRIFENKLLLSLSFALFMGLAFPPYGCTALSFVAFFPLLLLDKKLDHAPTRSEQNAIKRYIFLGFVAFVLFTTWWVKNAAWIGLAGGTAMKSLGFRSAGAFPFRLDRSSPWLLTRVDGGYMMSLQTELNRMLGPAAVCCIIGDGLQEFYEVSA